MTGKLLFYPVAWVWMVISCLTVQAQQEPLHVLVLNSYDESVAPYFRPTEIFENSLQQYYPTPIAFQDIDLRQRGVSSQDQVDQPIAELLLKRYVDGPPRLVMAIGPPAIDFWLQYRDSIFPDALFVAMARESIMEQRNFKPADAPIITRFNFTEVAENILRLKPGTTKVIMVFGDSPAERTLSEGARRELEPYANRFSLEFTNDLSIPEIQDLLASLPANAAVFFGILSADVNGVTLQQYSGLKMARAASTVPVFGPFEDQLGNGIVGGRLIQVEQLGKVMAEAAQQLLTGTHGPSTVKTVELSEPVYDWRELQAWGIDPGLLPPGSTVLFQPPTFWERYGVWVLLVAAVVLTQTWILLTLLRQRRQRRRAELAHASLGRRLITAHEDERRLIARELHDDLSQRLARVSIDAGFVQARQGTDSANEVLKNLHPELVSISKDVHDMSYRLHPSLVEELGIVAALRSEIERLQQRIEITVNAEIDDVAEQLPPDVGLCIYRIAQEALQNAVKHAQANAIEIAFRQTAQGLVLTVRDDGVGFDVTDVRDTFSLGLSSMQERANLANGSLIFHSKPGAGTTVKLSVPYTGETS